MKGRATEVNWSNPVTWRETEWNRKIKRERTKRYIGKVKNGN